jgi:ferredoxin
LSDGVQPRKLVAVEVDPDLCVGSTLCVAAAPQSFVMQVDGHAAYIGDTANADVAAEAAQMCPVSAIRLVYGE